MAVKKFKCACGMTTRATGSHAKKVMKPFKVKFKNTGGKNAK